MDEPSSGTLFQIIEEVYKNGNSNPDYLEILNIFSNDLSNFTKCKEMIENTDNSIYVQIFASQALLKLTEIDISNWTIDFSIEFCDWSINFMLKNCLGLENKFLYDLSDIVSFVLEYFWISSKESHQKCLSEWNDIICIFDRDSSDWVPGLVLISSIHDKLIKSKDKKVVESFTKECLSKAFTLAYSAAKRIRNTTVPNFEPIIDISLNIIEKCIYDRKEKYEIVGLLYDEQINFCFDIYNNFQMSNSLKCLYAIASSIPIFDHFDKPKIVELLCLGFFNILNGKIESISEVHLRFIFAIISDIATHLQFSVIQQMTIDRNLKNFIEMMFEITNILIQPNSNYELSTIKNIILFWQNIEISLRNDGNVEPKKNISALAPQLCINYIKYLLSIQNFDLKSESTDFISEESIESVTIDNDILKIMKGKLSSFIFPIQNFVILNHEEICPQLLNGLKEKRDELISSLETPGDNVVINEGHLVFFVEIAIVVLLIKKGARIDPKIKYHSEFFAFLISLFHLSEEWVSNGILFPRLEMSLIIFISNFKNTLFGLNDKILYNQLKNKRIFSSFEQCQYFLFDQAITTLRFFNEQCLISQALSIIHNNDNKIIPSPNTLELIFGSPFDQSFPFINSFENNVLRSRFYSAIFSIIKKLDDINFVKFANLMFEMINKNIKSIDIESITENNEAKKQICLLSADIYGIFNEAKENSSFNQVFEWFISNDRSKLFEIAVSSIISKGEESETEGNEDNDIIFNSILQMWKSISLCTPRTRIVFNSSSANGLILFKSVASILIQYYNYIELFERNHELTDNKIEGIEYSFLVFQNVISGKYVPFGAFKVYNDSIFIDLLTIMSKMMTEGFLKTVQHYPSAFYSMCCLFKELMVNQIETLLEIVHPLVILILDISINILLNEKDIQQNTLETILAFLQYINDYGVDCKPFLQQIEGINYALWNKILKEDPEINESLIKNLKLLYSINSWLLTAVKDKIKPNLSNRKKPFLEEHFSNLEHYFSSIGSQTDNDIIACIKDIVEINCPCTTVFFC